MGVTPARCYTIWMAAKKETPKRGRPRKSTKTSPEAKAKQKTEVRLMLRNGKSLRHVAQVFGLTQTTIARWRDEDKEPATKPARGRPAKAKVLALPEPPPEPEEDGGAELEDVPDDADTLTTVRAMSRNMKVMARRAERDGNHTAAQRYMRDAAGLVPVIARLEKLAGEEGEILKVSKAQIELAMKGVRDRVETLTARPLLCADCGCKLSIQQGTRGKPMGTAAQ